MELGIYTFAELASDPVTGKTITASERLHHLMEEIELADQISLDVFGIGEHHLSVGTMPHEKIMKSIELFGTKVAPAVRKAIGK